MKLQPERFRHRISDPRRQKALKARSSVEQGIRHFFLKQGFLETRTPLLVPSPGMEVHIRPIEVCGEFQERVFLPTSPEFAMKKLLVGGLEKIFQICPAFRAEPFSRTHSPEFTLLEWYRADAPYERIMQDVEYLFQFLAKEINDSEFISYQDKLIDLRSPWPRFSTQELFLEHAGIDLRHYADRDYWIRQCQRLNTAVHSTDTVEDIYFKIWLNHIENRLPHDRPVIVDRYPSDQAALAVVEKDDQGDSWAKRFEVYIAGIELGNAFQELTDPNEQRGRFLADMRKREQIYGNAFPVSPIDEGFMTALEEGLPPSSGIAMGVDRMVMLFADEPDIDFTFWLPPFFPNSES